MALEPITREETYLAAAAGQIVETPEPITRKEMFLDAIAKSGGGGGTGGGTGGGGGSGGSNPFRLLRTVTIPTDASTDTSGVTWLERPAGGYWFGFDTDADGNPFEVTELIIVTDGKVASSDPNSNVLLCELKYNKGSTPYYGQGGYSTIRGEVLTNKLAWHMTIYFRPFIQDFFCWNLGSAYNSVQANREMKTFNGGESITSISTYLNSANNYGFTAGTIYFYGR